MFNNGFHVENTVAIRPVHINTHLIKTLQWTRTHPAHHNRLHLGAMEDIDRDHAPPRDMFRRWYYFHRFYLIVVIKLDNSKNITMTEMTRTTGLHSSGVISWNSYTHLYFSLGSRHGRIC